MQRASDMSEVTLTGSALTIGSFDGVHRGHQALIDAMVRDARRSGWPAVVLTFFPHPSVVLRGRQPTFYISSPDEKAELLGRLGVDLVITQRFDEALSLVTASGFLDLLGRHLELRSLWVGEDFSLGHNREGNRYFLERAGQQRGFALHVVPPAMVGGEVISSTRVREALRAGDVAHVAEYLGRTFRLPGKIIRGAGRGKRIGIPTANLHVWDERAYPGPGVYAGLAGVSGRSWPAVTNIGLRPTFESGAATPVIEAHLLDFNQPIYDQPMTLVFIERLRDERRFPGPEALMEQIRRDIARARPILAAALEADHG
ncbi:MAG: riboflavin biosynthesis protein RibF [Actinobacteria bacterium]|nr:riboflavin biosynthesis protein RibF [Actinomycetota bacterium]